MSQSAREMEVLQLLAEGASNQDIAHELVITVATVKRHMGNISTNWRLRAGHRRLPKRERSICYTISRLEEKQRTCSLVA